MVYLSKNFLERFFSGLILILFLIIFNKKIQFLMLFLSFLMLFEAFFAIKLAKISYLKSFFVALLVLFCLLGFVISVLKGKNLFKFILATFILDTSSYIGGNLIKSPNIFPISPKKTLSGYITGIICGTIAYIILIKLDLLFAILITLISILGDLLFSFLKRTLKIKDFSHIIPGHGGVLDRFDSLCLSYILYSILL